MKAIFRAGVYVFILVCPGLVVAQDDGALSKTYRDLATKNDIAGLEALWRQHPAAVLATIDADLEGSLKLIEEGRPRHDKEVKAMRARARRGALAADAAFGRVIFTDYAMSFIGWQSAEQARFRNGQKAHGASREALKAGDYTAALAAGQRCVELAHPLGDWWGTAMGWGDVALAHEASGDIPAAVTAHSTAHLIYYDLGLLSSAQRHAQSMALLLEKQGNLDRAMSAIEAALNTAKARKDTSAILEFSEVRVRIHTKWYEKNFGQGDGG